MTPRRWQNLAKLCFDVGKLLIASAILAQLVRDLEINWKVVALGTIAVVCLFTMGFYFDRRGDNDELS